MNPSHVFFLPSVFLFFYNYRMTYNELFYLFQKENIPYPDIRILFDSYFHMPVDSLGIHGFEEVKEGPKEVLEKLKAGYPANYIAGYIDMLSLHIFLNEDTLIPRNETAQFIHDYVKDHLDLNHKKVLDLCTGSGFIALAVKKYFPDSDVYASDICQNALECAKKSADFNNLKVSFFTSDFLKDTSDVYDVIISNPPYIEEDSKDVFAPYEPALALFSGKDGLDSYRSIFRDLPSHLKKGGSAFFELESTNSIQTETLFHEIHKEGFKTSLWKDWYGRDRYLIVESIA